MRLVYLSEGRLFLHESGRDPVAIESPFARAHVERAAERQTRHAWKNTETEGTGPFNARTVWGRQAENHAASHPTFRYVTRGARPDEILYVLGMSHSSGLFRYRLDSGEEQRLFHRQDFEACGLSCDPVSGRIFVAVRDQEGLAKIQLVDEDARRREPITAGEGHDAHPAYDPRRPQTIYFQSAGAGRNERGELVDLGPTALHQLDLETGTMETIVEDEQSDHLAPRATSDGTLYFVRRPYRFGREASTAAQIKAFLLIPVKLVGAVYGFLDAFTRLFARQSLRPAGGPDVKMSRTRYATFLDHAVDLQRALDRISQGANDVKLVPDCWELVRRSTAGEEKTVARHVVAYDVGPDGNLIYTDGLKIWQQDGTLLARPGNAIIQSVVAL